MSRGPDRGLNDCERWETEYPTIRWRDPQRIVLSGKKGWTCRVCIAERGLAGTDIHRVYEAFDDCADHILKEHIERRSPIVGNGRM